MHDVPPDTGTVRELTPRLLVAAYCQGAFPMARSRHAPEVDWYSPDPRAVLPLENFHCPKTVRQKVRQGRFEIRHDTAFREVIEACAEPRSGYPDTWINDAIIRAFTELHEAGFAHSVETWREGRLVGGLYGVALGGVFCGESMFHRPELGGTDASKVALVHLVQHLKKRGFTLLDVQINNPHMRRFGAIDIPQREYLDRLAEALAIDPGWTD